MEVNELLNKRVMPFLPVTLTGTDSELTILMGEDQRYRLSYPGLKTWITDIFLQLDGSRELHEILVNYSREQKQIACQVIDRLIGERVLTFSNHEGIKNNEADEVLVFNQTDFDYKKALDFSIQCRNDNKPWIWVFSAASDRAYVSPVFLPNEGLCLNCILEYFKATSPLPQLYSLSQNDMTKLEGSSDAEWVQTVLDSIVSRKQELFKYSDQPSSTYKLHIFDLNTIEVKAISVMQHDHCDICSEGKDERRISNLN